MVEFVCLPQVAVSFVQFNNYIRGYKIAVRPANSCGVCSLLGCAMANT